MEKRARGFDRSEIDAFASQLQALPHTYAASPCPMRLSLFILPPVVFAFMLTLRALYYNRIIPDGDIETRHMVVAICLSMAALGFALATATLARYAFRKVVMEPERLTLSRRSRQASYPWHDVSVSLVSGRSGVRRLTIATPDGHATIVEAFYPNFQKTYQTMARYSDAARTRRSQGA